MNELARWLQSCLNSLIQCQNDGMVSHDERRNENVPHDDSPE